MPHEDVAAAKGRATRRHGRILMKAIAAAAVMAMLAGAASAQTLDDLKNDGRRCSARRSIKSRPTCTPDASDIYSDISEY
jgi:hypothetical protein